MAESTFDPDLFASLIEDVSRLKVGAGIDQVEVKPVETATRIKEKLLEKFDEYRLPRMSLAEFYEYALLETRQRLDAATERNQRRRAAGMLIVNADTELYKRNLKTWTCQENNINFGYDFAENRFDMEKPLSFSGEVNIEDYENPSMITNALKQITHEKPPMIANQLTNNSSPLNAPEHEKYTEILYPKSNDGYQMLISKQGEEKDNIIRYGTLKPRAKRINKQKKLGRYRYRKRESELPAAFSG